MAHTFVPDLPASFVAIVREWRAEIKGTQTLMGCHASGSVLTPVERDNEEERWRLFGPAWCWGRWVESPCIERWKQRYPEEFAAAVRDQRQRKLS